MGKHTLFLASRYSPHGRFSFWGIYLDALCSLSASVTMQLRKTSSFTAPLMLIALAVNLLPAQAEPVQVRLHSGLTVDGRSVSGIDTFNGIPYAVPPTGSLRIRPPQRLPGNQTGRVDATGIAAACPQLLLSPADDTIVGKVGGELLQTHFLSKLTGQEDCLTVSIQRPVNTRADSKLPVLFWIFGGGYAFGATNTYDASSMVAEGVANDQPFIYVAVNYRLNGFGFLPGAEVLKDGSANVGLLDQRLALEWVAENIEQFGGDPDKVTIWGESAGAFSVFYQMALFDGNATYKGRPLFRAGILNSGVGVPAEPMDGPKGQAVYDKVVAEAGCSNAADTLTCLRDLDYDTYYKAVTENFNSAFSFYGTKISFLPRPDGRTLLLSPEEAAATGRYFAVPIIVGNQEDEGTLFSLFQQSIKSDTELVDYFANNDFPNASKADLTEWVTSYSASDVGSPFRTPKINGLYPMFKQIAATIGDQSFILARRKFLESHTAAHPKVPAWSYLSSYAHHLPILGTAHATDLAQVFFGLPPTFATSSTRRYYGNFLYNLDPNSGADDNLSWPLWRENRTLLWFETQFKNSHVRDDFRSQQYEALLKLGDSARQ